MMFFRKPGEQVIRDFRNAQRALDFTYAAVGATRDMPPAGFVVDRTRIRLGTGVTDFLAAKAALERWQQFHLDWVEASPRDTPIRAGESIAVLGHACGIWWLNACRIVYVVDEIGPVSRFGFAYGTLPGHVECGEERFLIEWDPVDDSVWYAILAFSRPQHVLAKLGYPVVRRLQKQFARDSATAMFHAVAGDAVLPPIVQRTE